MSKPLDTFIATLDRPCVTCGGPTIPPYVGDDGYHYTGWYCEEHGDCFVNEPIPVRFIPTVLKFTGLRHEVAVAALGLLLFPGIEVSVTKTTATLTGTPEDILTAARQAFLNAENSGRWPQRSPEEAAAYRLLLKVSDRFDAITAAARTKSLEV